MVAAYFRLSSVLAPLRGQAGQGLTASLSKVAFHSPKSGTYDTEVGKPGHERSHRLLQEVMGKRLIIELVEIQVSVDMIDWPGNPPQVQTERAL